MAASLSFGLIKNHAFIDGNKRVGLAVLVDFLDLNGQELRAPVSEAEEMVRRAAASELTEAGWRAWVGRIAAPLSGD